MPAGPGRPSAADGADNLVRRACVLFIFTAVGFMMWIGGWYQNQRYEDLEAADDFTAGDCTVAEVKHSARDGTAGTSFLCVGDDCPQSCDDVYVFMLDASALGVASVEASEPEVIERSGTQLCPSDAPRRASALGHAVRSAVPCWAAKTPLDLPRHNSGVDGSAPSDGYRCGSLACVKIYDPALEVVELKEIGRGLQIGGIFGMAFGLSLMACGAYFRQAGHCCHPKLVSSEGAGVHHGMSHPTRGASHA